MHMGMGSLFNTMCGCEGILPVRLSYYDNHSTHFAGREGVALVLEGREGKGEGNLWWWIEGMGRRTHCGGGNGVGTCSSGGEEDLFTGYGV